MYLRIIMKILVNLITTIRLVGSFLLFFIIKKISNRLFILIIAILFFSDFLDGMLARKFKVQTFYGSVMDTVADKVLSILLMIPLLQYGNWIKIILFGEISIAILSILGRLCGKHTKASIVGKVKMWLLAITIILGYCYCFKWFNLIYFMLSGILTIGIQGYVISEYYFYLKRQEKGKNRICFNYNFFDFMYLLFSTEYYQENILLLDEKIK